jgi:hypothetical protein
MERQIMTKVAKFAAALAMTASVFTLAATTVDAQERRGRNREAAPAAPATPPVSRPFATAFQPLNTAINASDWPAAEAALTAAQTAAVSPFEKYLVAQSEFRMAAGQSNAARQLSAIGAMIDSNGAPEADRVRITVAGGQLAYNAGQYPLAATRIARALELGATTEGLPLLLIDTQLRGGQIDQAVATARSQISSAEAAGGKPPEQVYSLIARALQEADRTPDLLDFLRMRAAAYPTPQNFRTASLIFIQSMPEDRGINIDLLRLMTAAGAMDDRRFFVEYASSLTEDALPNEVLTAIAAGRAANLIPANDQTFRELEQTARDNIAEDRASLAGGERRAIAAPEARLATRIADAYFAYENFAKAEELYMLALGKTSADTALINTRLGITRYRAGNHAGALEALGQVQSGPRSTVARYWEALVRSKMAPAAAAPAPAPAPAAAPATTS